MDNPIRNGGLGFVAIALLISPFAIWKIGEIMWWIFTHMYIGVR